MWCMLRVKHPASNRLYILSQGRPSVDEIAKMLLHIDKHNKSTAPEHRIKTSVELEKSLPSLGKVALLNK